MSAWTPNRLHFLWRCQWRVRREAFEYWTLYQFGPFYVLRRRAALTKERPC